MKGVIVFAVVVAAIATAIAALLTYWYIPAAIAGAGFAGYYFYRQRKDQENKV